MKRIIIFCLLLVAMVARAEEVSSWKYGDFVVTKTIHEGEVTYSLSYEDIPLLDDKYQFSYNETLRFIVMYNAEDIFVFYTFKKEPIFKYHFEEVQNERPIVIFEKIEKVDGASCYEVSIKYSEDDPDEIVVGTFCKIGDQTYRYSLEPID